MIKSSKENKLNETNVMSEGGQSKVVMEKNPVDITPLHLAVSDFSTGIDRHLVLDRTTSDKDHLKNDLYILNFS